MATLQINDVLFYVVSIAILSFAAGLLHLAQATEPEPEATLQVCNGELNDTPYFVYRMGNSTHFIRVDAIASIIWMDGGVRNVVNYAGGSLGNGLDLDDFTAAIKLFKKQTAEGTAPSLSDVKYNLLPRK